MLLRARWWLLGLLLSFGAAAEVRVAVSIKPLHSLVAALMEGVGSPHLIIQGSESPHTAQLKPSQARQLTAAQLVVWLGPQLESSLSKALAVLSAGADIIELGEIAGLHRLPRRQQALFATEAHNRGINDDHGAHDDHTNHPATAKDDPHIWLSIKNAAVMADAIALFLAERDAANADRYQRNNAALKARLAAFDRELTAKLQPARQQPFIVLHDAFQYYEHHFRLSAVGAVMPSLEIPPGAARLQQLQMQLRRADVSCIFTEPQIKSTYIERLAEHAGIRVGRFDALGSAIPEGPMLYFTLLRRIADAMLDCFSAG